MARLLRADIGGVVYHVINRANARAHIFNIDKEYKQFEQILKEDTVSGTFSCFEP